MEEGRLGVVVTFMAILEMVKEGVLSLVQTESFGAIHVKARVQDADGEGYDLAELDEGGANDAFDAPDEGDDESDSQSGLDLDEFNDPASDDSSPAH